jgi:hypothetical protein
MSGNVVIQGVLQRKPPIPPRMPVLHENKQESSEKETEQDKITTKPSETSNTQIEMLQKSLGTNWQAQNIDTLTNWVWVGSHSITMLTLAISQKRFILRLNAMIGILLSTLTGTLSASQYNNTSQNNYYMTVFTVLSFIVASFNGYMKIAQIQETLEEYIRIKQQWVFFTTIIFSEFQLPVHLRQDALYLIWKYKGQYLDLIKIDLDISPYLRSKAESMLQTYINRFDDPELKLSRINNFLFTLLDMPKEVGFSTQLPNLMLDAILLNDTKTVKKSGDKKGSGNSKGGDKSSDKGVDKDTKAQTQSQSQTQPAQNESESSNSSVVTGETLEVFDNTPQVQARGSLPTLSPTQLKAAIQTPVPLNRKATLEPTVVVGK